MKKKKILIILIILVLLLIFTIIGIINIINNKNNNGKTIKESKYSNGDETVLNTTVHRLNDRNIFFEVEEAVQKYINYITNSNNSDILKVLDTAYINSNSITIDNVENFINKSYKGMKFEAIQMNEIEGEVIDIYGVYGRIYNAETIETISYDYFIVLVDKNNFTFMIEPINENYNNIDQLKLKTNIEKIAENSANGLEYRNITDEDVANKYYEYYKNLLTYDVDKAYLLLNSEYKEKRFPTIDSFKKYVNESKNNVPAIMTGYKYDEDTSKYTIKDSNNNYYIIHENYIMDFDIKLDAYTVKSSEYDSKYSKLSDSAKISANIEQTIMMINNKDYSTVYSKLDDEFKKNNFDTEAKFETYIKNNLFNNNYWTAENVKQEGNIYICTGTIKDSIAVAAQTKKVSFIIRLNAGTDYTMSFNIK